MAIYHSNNFGMTAEQSLWQRPNSSINLEDELADPQPRAQHDVQRPSVPDLQLNRVAGEVRILALAEAGVNRGGRDVNPDTQVREAAFAFDSLHRADRDQQDDP